MASDRDVRALLLVDHGSRDPGANHVLEQMAALLRTRLRRPVFFAHLERAEPTVNQAVAAAVAVGTRFIHVFPYFLTPGRHALRDVPDLVAAAVQQYPGVEWRMLPPFGPDSALVELIVQRLGTSEIPPTANSKPC